MTKLSRCQEDLVRCRGDRDQNAALLTAALSELAVARAGGEAKDAAIETLGAEVAALEQELSTATRKFHDPCTDPDPLPLWKALEAGASETDWSRYEFRDGWRWYTVAKGDNWHGYGPRAEAGYNSLYNTACVFYPGERTLTTINFMPADGFRADLPLWQVITQQKQVAPYSGTETPPGPALTVNIYGEKLRLEVLWHELRTMPFPQSEVGRPHKLEILALHRNDELGETQIRLDEGIWTPMYKGQNLVTNASKQPLPSHLRVGLYHNLDYETATNCIGEVVVDRA